MCSRLFLVSSRVVCVVRSSGEHRLSLICCPPVFLVLSARGIPWKLTIDPRKSLVLIWLAPSRPWRTPRPRLRAPMRAIRYGGGGGDWRLRGRISISPTDAFTARIWNTRGLKAKWEIVGCEHGWAADVWRSMYIDLSPLTPKLLKMLLRKLNIARKPVLSPPVLRVVFAELVTSMSN